MSKEDKRANELGNYTTRIRVLYSRGKEGLKSVWW